MKDIYTQHKLYRNCYMLLVVCTENVNLEGHGMAVNEYGIYTGDFCEQSLVSPPGGKSCLKSLCIMVDGLKMIIYEQSLQMVL